MMISALSEDRSAVFSVFRLPTPGLGNEVSRGGFPLPSPASNWTLTACSGPHMVSRLPTRCPGAFCRIGLYCPAGFRTRDFQGCTPKMLPFGDNCAPAFSCRYFQGGHPPSANRARRCLTSVIDRERIRNATAVAIYIYIYI